MNDEQHLSTDQLADLVDGSLPAAEQMSANGHLATCELCAGARDDQLWVATLLATDASDPLPMPSDVSLRLNLTIEHAAQERATQASSLDEARRRRGTRSLRWLSGAAAVVVVAGIGVAAWQIVDNGGAGSPSAGSPAGQPTGPSPTRDRVSGPDLNQGTSRLLPPVTSESRVSSLARQVSVDPTQGIPPARLHCARPIGPGVFAVVHWHGHKAVMDVHRDTRTVSILDCATAVQQLYSTGY